MDGDVIAQTGLQRAIVMESSFEPIEFQFHGRYPGGDVLGCLFLGSKFWDREMARVSREWPSGIGICG